MPASPRRRCALHLALAWGLCSSTGSAADAEVDAPASVEQKASPPFEIGASAGYASAPIRGGVNPFGPGFGGQLGYTISGVYLGANARYYLGGSDVGATDRALLFGVVLGYGLHLGEYVVVRPSLGVGDTAVSHTEPLATPDVITTASGGTSTRNSVTTTVNNVYVAPSLMVMLAAKAHYAGVTFGSLVVPGITYGPAPAQSATWLSYSVELHLGFRL